MTASLAKWLFTVCRVCTALGIYSLLVVSLISGDFKPAIIGPVLGFTFGAALVIFTVWRAPEGIGEASGSQPANWQGFLMWLWWFFAFLSASFMLWVAGMFAVGGVVLAVSALLGLDTPAGSAAAIVVLAWFGGALWLSAPGLLLATQRE